MIELAVILPVLILIAIGVMDYGRVYFTSVAVANAARAGAEWGAAEIGRTGQSANIQNFSKLDGAEAGAITVTSTSFCQCSGSNVACTSSCGGYGFPREFVQVTASKTVTMLLRYPGLPATVTVSRTATFRAQ
jgi:Flp pilus assembly protein TadG